MTNSQQPQPQAQLEVNTPVMIVLPFGAWTNVLQLIGKNPWENVNGLMLAIQQQLKNAAEQRQQDSGRQAMQPKPSMIERD